jgi:outer membrane murein-binding lipoprotein Lpp
MNARGLSAIVMVGILLAGCSSDPKKCKRTAQEASVQFIMQAPFTAGEPNAEIDEAKQRARTKWTAAVTEKFGVEWADWQITKSKDETCGAATGTAQWTCIAKAPPCKFRAGPKP